MAANINITNGIASFAGTKLAWHKMGQVVDNAMTSEQALQLAGLNFNVSKQQLFTNDGKTAHNSFGTFRDDTDTYLGTVGKSYTVVQNKDAFLFFDAIVGGNQAIFETAGCLNKGEKVFITAKLPNDIIVNGDVISQYLFLYNSHNGSSAITCAFTPVRVVCENTLTAALKHSTNKISIRHTTNVRDNLMNARQLMGIILNLSVQHTNAYNNLAASIVTDSKIKELITSALQPTDKYINKDEYSTRFTNMVNDVYTFTKEHETQKGIENTLWGIYNGITGYYNYEKDYKSDENKLNSILFGDVNKKVQKAFNLITSYI